MTDFVRGSSVWVDPLTGTRLTITADGTNAPDDAQLRAVAKALAKDPDLTLVMVRDKAWHHAHEFTITRTGRFTQASAQRFHDALVAGGQKKPVTPKGEER